jgi:hypothetical protein
MMKLFAALALTAGCAVDASSPSEPADESAPPRIALRLTDAPGDFEHVWVNIASVAVSAPDGWLAITDEPQKFDLLTLQNDVTAALGSASLAPGAYEQLRLIVDEASVVVDGVESPLEIASGMQTGIKINLDTTFEAGMTYQLTLDYDAAKSVKSTGHGYLMTPVIQLKDLLATPTEPTEPEPEPAEPIN